MTIDQYEKARELIEDIKNLNYIKNSFNIEDNKANPLGITTPNRHYLELSNDILKTDFKNFIDSEIEKLNNLLKEL